jgi:predicted transcriptional regulator
MIKSSKTSKAQQLTPEELQEFKETYESYQKAVFDLGLLTVEIDDAKQKLDDLNGEKIDLTQHLKELAVKQQEISNALGEKYGDKQVDLETGNLK